MIPVDEIVGGGPIVDSECARHGCTNRVLGSKPSVCYECLKRGDERAQIRERERVSEDSIPGAFSWARLDAKELDERVRCKDFIATVANARKIARIDRRVVLMGDPGTGKTSLGVAMLRAWRERTGQVAILVSAWKLAMARIQNRAGDGEPKLVESAMRTPLVMIDDLGAERDHATSAVLDVIHERHAEGRPTWITTNYDNAAMTARYGAHAARRVFEGAVVLEFGGTT